MKTKPTTARSPNRIWQAIKRSRYSQREVARLLGYRTASNISRWQNGSKLPTLAHAIGLSVALSTNVDALFPEIRRRWAERINPRREKI